jgi:hypothetical protein
MDRSCLLHVDIFQAVKIPTSFHFRFKFLQNRSLLGKKTRNPRLACLFNSLFSRQSLIYPLGILLVSSPLMYLSKARNFPIKVRFAKCLDNSIRLSAGAVFIL